MKRERDRIVKTQLRGKIDLKARRQRIRELVGKHHLTLAEAEFTVALEEGEVDGDEVALIDGVFRNDKEAGPGGAAILALLKIRFLKICTRRKGRQGRTAS